MKPNGFFQNEPLSFDYPESGEKGVKLRPLDVPNVDINEALPNIPLREDNLKDLPQLSEFETIRHFTRLSLKNVSIDSGMYPLGSCTMKYNPRINEVVSRFSGFTQTHPLMGEELIQGNLELIYLLERYLMEICGLDAVTLQPAAGAQGELTGMLLIRACQNSKGEHRKYVLIPDSAHGTNPSSAHLAGYEVKEIKSYENGLLDVDSLKENMNEDVAGLMITNPNTLGIFERNIVTIAEIVHQKGGFVYCDGANMNAQVGISRPGDYGVDVIHLNLHKTFSTPHGGGGPGSGPCLCTVELAPFLPVPRVEKEGNLYRLNWNIPTSIGKISTFYGNFGILIRTLAFILSMGKNGLKEMSETAVLNANYLKEKLKNVLALASKEPSLHEVVFSDKTLHSHGNITTQDLAKRLMDYGFHPPTVYFPLIVSGALMIEPTESESRTELDRFAEAIETIIKEADENPELVKTAPHHTPIRRLDETLAARKPLLRWVNK